MLLNHIPDPIQLLDYIDDGEHARHYRFRLLGQNKNHDWRNVQAGQFFMLNVASVGEAPFTFTEPPNEHGEFRAFIRQMGKVTSTLFSMKAGDILGARGPFGRGWPLEKIKNSNTIIVAGGCGLAPLVNLIDRLISPSEDQHNNQQLALIYGARNRQSQMLNPERTRWENNISIFNTLDEPSDQDYPSSTIQGSPLDILAQAIATFDSPPKTALLCGPELMMNCIAEYFVDYGLPPESIFLSMERRMHCAVGLCGHCYLGNKYVCKDGPTFSWQELQQLTQC